MNGWIDDAWMDGQMVGQMDDGLVSFVIFHPQDIFKMTR